MEVYGCTTGEEIVIWSLGFVSSMKKNVFDVLLARFMVSNIILTYQGEKNTIKLTKTLRLGILLLLS